MWGIVLLVSRGSDIWKIMRTECVNREIESPLLFSFSIDFTA